jgi:beta-glucosidase
MPRRARSLVAVVAVVLVGCGGTPPSSPASSTPAPAIPASAPPSSAAIDWRDSSIAPTARADALLRAMTPSEKIGQMTQLELGSVTPQTVADLALGSVLSGGGGAPLVNDAENWHRMVSTFQSAALGTRLGIPIVYGVDAVHGHNTVVGATIFPHNIGLGAAGDAGLVERIGRVTAEEMVATGVRWNFGPVVAVPQDVRWGRTYEGFGQDPALVGSLAGAYIRGLQGASLADSTSVAATAKHFVGDGGTGWGTSTTGDYEIDQGVTDVDDATLRDVHLAPYLQALEAGARIVMASFSSTTAGKVHGDRHLLTDVLKGELGFTGFVVSDWAGVDQVDPDYDTAVAQAISAGIDMAMVPSDGQRFQTAVQAGLIDGTIAPDRIDDAVRRILLVKFEMGLFEEPMPPAAGSAVLGSEANRALGREAAAASAVLLATKTGVLPVGPDETILLAGSGADDIGLQSGGWTITWQGSRGDITPGTTIGEALRERYGERVIGMSEAEGRGPLPVGVVVVAEPPYAEGVGDSATLELPADDIAAVQDARPLVDRLVVVILSGRPVMLDEILPEADAVIAAWLPGTEGAGVVDVLVGDVPFTAATPFAWPRTPADAPRTGRGACEGAVFPVGFGLDGAGASLGPASCP